jgi:hypothetical protein
MREESGAVGALHGQFATLFFVLLRDLHELASPAFAVLGRDVAVKAVLQQTFAFFAQQRRAGQVDLFDQAAVRD